ncbi:nucleotidyl transferase AbiEii/AbiGii toxin family protein [Fodinibius sediminis]|uniref:Nucleotidyl transferase AbiEii toxin, Type IV TA system n=1 Tax=Fodinibius sediminis TaxID=1214077 RepID=A0A521F1D9_9BACT|nr:nucleotidyl transferase AbiEii/AbiGii toxin family protein [Fodinibius sediminis]SMO89989.1 Nucleotidyl transferase AbiEii toxin, Type IV TA system [Fodinibius sediminis]
MIPKAYIDAWRTTAPWQQDAQIEQDLVISRALVELFSNDFLREHLAFRGGTALHKLFLHPQARYSEDIDLVQLKEGRIKPILEAIHDQLLFLGGKEDRDVQSADHNWTVYYSFETEYPPPPEMRIKIEINTREHINILDLNEERFTVENRWFSGSADIVTYQPEELLGTKLRALYQRKKGRDLFDLHYALTHLEVDTGSIIRCFQAYMEENDNRPPTGREFELNLEEKMQDREFTGDIKALLRPEIKYDQDKAYEHVFNSLIRNI